MTSQELSDQEINDLCCTRLGWELKPHLWEYGSVWHDRAWFKGETLMGYPNFLTQDPVLQYLDDLIEERQLQAAYGMRLFELLEARHLSHSLAWYRLANAPLRLRALAFLQVTETDEQI
ncbi:hypothetical protein [Deinococcus roseus]|uniref:hypothetical protein n=1 Tax=Deinococcus roseus TaxID=392414 RepID=UPI001666A865|nr:hypothetical protein [Deinococcus roseus]